MMEGEITSSSSSSTFQLETAVTRATAAQLLYNAASEAASAGMGEIHQATAAAAAVSHDAAAESGDGVDVWGMPMFEKNEAANISDEDYLAMVSNVVGHA